MTDVDNLNMWLTIISIVVTTISIICSVWSFCSAKKAKQYKEETMKFRDTIELESLHSRFMTESKHFNNNTRSDDWYRGIDVNTVISPFAEVIFMFGNSYHLMQDAEGLKKKIHRLHEIVQDFIEANNLVKKESRNLIIEITDALQQEIHRNSENIIKTK